MIEKLQRLVIGNDDVDIKKGFLWNMLGSTIFAGVSMLLSFFIIHVMGEDIGGVFSIAITLSQMFAFIAYYEIRTYQVTDVNHVYQFSEYKGTKLLLCIAMMIVCVAYVMIKEQSFSYKAIVILLMCIYRMIDGYAELYEGTFQLDGRLDLTGKSQAFRTILSAGALVISVLLTHKLILSIVIGIVAAVIGLFLFDIMIMKAFRTITPSFSKEKMWSILQQCFPLFVGSFLWTYILSAGRIAIDSNMTNNYLSYYQTLFMPVNVINLCATFIMKPALTTLSDKYNKPDKKEFHADIGKIFGVIGILTVVCMIGAYLLGIPVLSVLAGCDLHAYKGVLVFLMLAGGINSAAYFMYYILTIMRRMNRVLIGYVSGAALALIISGICVRKAGIWGAAVSFCVVVVYLCIAFGSMILMRDKD